jgi:hypothetical protein
VDALHHQPDEQDDIRQRLIFLAQQKEGKKKSDTDANDVKHCRWSYSGDPPIRFLKLSIHSGFTKS